jgi:hypothetical protein
MDQIMTVFQPILMCCQPKETLAMQAKPPAKPVASYRGKDAELNGLEVIPEAHDTASSYTCFKSIS